MKIKPQFDILHKCHISNITPYVVLGVMKASDSLWCIMPTHENTSVFCEKNCVFNCFYGYNIEGCVCEGEH